MRHSSPRYEVTENDKQFRLAVELPGVKEDNMKVELENEGRLLHLTFNKKEKTETSFKEFKFEKRFTLGKNLDTSKLTAHLSDGVLVLTAPKKEKLPPTTQEIPIIRGDAPALMDE
jgi:HSP20 family protein